jgi:hypothetical protein
VIGSVQLRVLVQVTTSYQESSVPDELTLIIVFAYAREGCQR